jgi:phenylacetate-CoA ligase
MDNDYFNPVIETMPVEELREIQEKKFKSQLDYVWSKSPFYQKKFKEAGLERNDVGSLDDLHKLPFTEKDELRKSQEECPPLGFHVVAPMDDIIRIHSSSGTTGIPTFVGITKHDHQVWTDITARSFFTQGLRRTDVLIHAVGLTFFVGGLPCKDAIEHIGTTFVPIGTGASERVVFTTKLLRATALHATPSYAIYLSEFIRKKYSMDPAELGFRMLTLGAEPGGGIPSIRTHLEQEFKARVTEGLGNSDAAPVIFGECPYQQGMHFNAQEYIVTELIDPDSGKVMEMKDDAEGELVYTLIDRECHPVVRFRTRDRIKVWTSRCECGRTSFRVRCLGRTDDMLIVLGVNVFPSAIKDIVASLQPRTTGEILVLLDKPGPNVQPPIVLQAEYTDKAGDLARLKKEIESRLHDRLLSRFEVELVPDGTLPRYEMKAKLVRKLYEEK